MHQSTTPSLSQTIWSSWASRQFLTLHIVETLLPGTFDYSLSSEAVVMRQLRRWKRLWRRSLTRSHKRTSMGSSRSCWNGTTSALQPGVITSRVYTINKSAHTKKVWKLIYDPRIYIYMYIYIYIYISKKRWSTKRFVFFEFIHFDLTYVLYICMFPACCFRQRTCVAQGLLNGVRNETWTHSCFQYKWFLSGQTCFYKDFVAISWSMFILFCFTLLWYLICACVCVGFGFY